MCVCVREREREREREPWEWIVMINTGTGCSPAAAPPGVKVLRRQNKMTNYLFLSLVFFVLF